MKAVQDHSGDPNEMMEAEMSAETDLPTATVQINGKYHKIPEEVSKLIGELTHQSENMRDRVVRLEADNELLREALVKSSNLRDVVVGGLPPRDAPPQDRTYRPRGEREAMSEKPNTVKTPINDTMIGVNGVTCLIPAAVSVFIDQQKSEIKRLNALLDKALSNLPEYLDTAIAVRNDRIAELEALMVHPGMIAHAVEHEQERCFCALREWLANHEVDYLRGPELDHAIHEALKRK